MTLIKWIAVASMCIISTACGDRAETPSATSTTSTLEMDLDLPLTEALTARKDTETDILLEASLTIIPAVADRVRQIKEDLDDKRLNNSVCLAGGRGSIGKTAFTCNHYNYDLLILARQPGETVASNLSYIEEFAGDPLRSSVSMAIHVLSSDPVNSADEDCLRIVFRSPSTHDVDRSVPIILMIRLGADAKPLLLSDSELARCLE